MALAEHLIASVQFEPRGYAGKEGEIQVNLVMCNLNQLLTIVSTQS